MAEEQKELLVQEGMDAALLDDLKARVTEFEAALQTVLTARRDHIGARADLEVITAELLKVVKVLDGITRYRFGMNPEKMAEWKAVRQVLGCHPEGGQRPEWSPAPPRSRVAPRHRATSPRRREGRDHGPFSCGFQGP